MVRVRKRGDREVRFCLYGELVLCTALCSEEQLVGTAGRRCHIKVPFTYVD